MNEKYLLCCDSVFEHLEFMAEDIILLEYDDCDVGAYFLVKIYSNKIYDIIIEDNHIMFLASKNKAVLFVLSKIDNNDAKTHFEGLSFLFNTPTEISLPFAFDNFKGILTLDGFEISNEQKMMYKLLQ